MDAPRYDVITAAERAIEVAFPGFEPGAKSPELSDQGENWKFTYKLPPGMLGGAPVALIDKSTLKIVRIYRTQ